MKSLLSALLVAALLTGMAAQQPTSKSPDDDDENQIYYCPQTHTIKNAPSQEYWLEGKIGDETVRMYLDRGGDGVVGVFYYLRDWKPMLLGGKWNEGGQVHAQLYSDGGSPKPGAPSLDGKLSNAGFDGTWSSPEANEAVRLEIKTQPNCDYDRVEWRSVDDPRWPITFSYPACWHIDVDDKNITLTPPDPRALAYSPSGIVLTKRTRELLRCGNVLQYGDGCTCNDSDSHICTQGTVIHQSDLTIVDVSAREWRLYCRYGTYLGQGEGSDLVLITDDMKVEIMGDSELVPKIANTARKRQ